MRHEKSGVRKVEHKVGVKSGEKRTSGARKVGRQKWGTKLALKVRKREKWGEKNEARKVWQSEKWGRGVKSGGQ